MIHTKPVSQADEAFLYQLYEGSRAEELAAWGMDEATRDMFLRMQWNAQRQSYEQQFPGADHQIVLEDDNKIGKITTYRNEQQIRLVDLIILPAFQKRGIGTRLLQELQQEAMREDKPLFLSVLQINPAKRLYERLGFVVTGGDEVYAWMVW
ncbi:GNAT family N-acetyltransferase [Brevibacillus fluminis]|uniref:GNAT family N-acetyltransferase n=1 Tax=Brevibacillus fluminis TaxID=511487 RepID=UPI001FEA45A3|nr:GNAT family N-acetyltransferase [Brevibacillus fluminis]